VDQALQNGRDSSSSTTFVQQNYHLHCPDEFEVRAAGATPYVEQCRIGPDGRVVLGGRGTVGVEGLKPEEIAIQFAHQLHCKPEQLTVRVTAYHSQQIFIFGEIAGLQRAVEYHGPETVSELLQRIGGLRADAAPGDVQVVRSHVADGRPPEVFDVNLAAIVLNNDNQTNVRLQPFDQVYIGQTLQGRMCRCLPPWLRPLFEQLCGMRRHVDTSPPPVGNGPRAEGHADPILPTGSHALQ
jgi:protein involved in polysaccharide export with SLBB domain